MVDISLNCVTKWAIVIVSSVMAVFTGIQLYRLFTMEGDMNDPNRVLGIVSFLFTIILCVLACWGAFTENSCLSCIAFGFMLVITMVTIWLLIECFIDKGDKCGTIDYVIRSLVIVIAASLTICILIFIQSIRK